MRPILLALLLATFPVISATPKPTYKKFSKMEVIRVYGKPLPADRKLLAGQAATRLEAAKVLLGIYEDTRKDVEEKQAEMDARGAALAYPDLYLKLHRLWQVCIDHEIELGEVIEYYQKVDKK